MMHRKIESEVIFGDSISLDISTVFSSGDAFLIFGQFLLVFEGNFVKYRRL